MYKSTSSARKNSNTALMAELTTKISQPKPSTDSSIHSSYFEERFAKLKTELKAILAKYSPSLFNKLNKNSAQIAKALIDLIEETKLANSNTESQDAALIKLTDYFYKAIKLNTQLEEALASSAALPTCFAKGGDVRRHLLELPLQVGDRKLPACIKDKSLTHYLVVGINRITDSKQGDIHRLLKEVLEGYKIKTITDKTRLCKQYLLKVVIELFAKDLSLMQQQNILHNALLLNAMLEAKMKIKNLGFKLKEKNHALISYYLLQPHHNKALPNGYNPNSTVHKKLSQAIDMLEQTAAKSQGDLHDSLSEQIISAQLIAYFTEYQTQRTSSPLYNLSTRELKRSLAGDIIKALSAWPEKKQELGIPFYEYINRILVHATICNQQIEATKKKRHTNQPDAANSYALTEVTFVTTSGLLRPHLSALYDNDNKTSDNDDSDADVETETLQNHLEFWAKLYEPIEQVPHQFKFPRLLGKTLKKSWIFFEEYRVVEDRLRLIPKNKQNFNQALYDYLANQGKTKFAAALAKNDNALSMLTRVFSEFSETLSLPPELVDYITEAQGGYKKALLSSAPDNYHLPTVINKQDRFADALCHYSILAMNYREQTYKEDYIGKEAYQFLDHWLRGLHELALSKFILLSNGDLKLEVKKALGDDLLNQAYQQLGKPQTIQYFSTGFSEVLYGAISLFIAEIGNSDEKDRLICLQLNAKRLTNSLLMDIPACTDLLKVLKHLIYVGKQLDNPVIKPILGEEEEEEATKTKGNQAPSLRQLHRELQAIINLYSDYIPPLDFANKFIKPLRMLLTRINTLQLPNNHSQQMLVNAVQILSPWLITLDTELRAGKANAQSPELLKPFFEAFNTYLKQNKGKNRRFNLSGARGSLFNQSASGENVKVAKEPEGTYQPNSNTTM